MPRVILHVDMDAFFASIEQRDNPEYLGKPVIVGSPPDRRGVVCAASYEARKFGVHSAMPSRTAGRLCPEGIFVRPRMDAYREESHRIMEIFGRFTEAVEQVSVDEAYLDLSIHFDNVPSADEALKQASTIGMRIKQRVLAERRLSASIGIAGNKFLAKLASDLQKPNGLTVIPETGKASFLRPMAVRSIHGVGPVTAQALEKIGIKTIGDLQDSVLPLEQVVGSWAQVLKQRAIGEDHRALEIDRERKSISAEHTFPIDTDDRSELRGALVEMAADIAQTLAAHHTGTRTIQVKVRYSDFTTLTRQIRLERPICSSREIYRISCHLLAAHKLVHGPLRLLGIGASTFCDAKDDQLWLPLDL
jgi:DNA polymerase-4